MCAPGALVFFYCRLSSPLARGVARSTGVSSAWNTVARPSQSKFSSCGGVPRSGEVVFVLESNVARHWRACVSPADCVLAASCASLGFILGLDPRIQVNRLAQSALLFYVVIPAKAGIHCPAGTYNTTTPSTTWTPLRQRRGALSATTKKQARQWRATLLSALCALLSNKKTRHWRVFIAFLH